MRIAQPPGGPTVMPWCRGLLAFVVAALTLTLVACPSAAEHSVLEVDATGAGTVRIDGVERSLPYAHQTIRGRTVLLEAVPTEGHTFVRWEGDLDGTATPTSIVIDRDRSVRALFVSAEAEPDPSEPTPPPADPDPEPDPDPGAEPDPEPEPPANDDFADRAPIGGASGSVTGSNVGATMQPDEPAHAGASGGSSVWWSWTAPAPVTVTFDVGASDIDAVVAVYEGEALADLRAPAGVLEADADGTWVTLTAVAGNPYHVAVDGRAGATGSVTLSWSSVPAAGSALWAVEPQTLSFVALVDGATPEPRIVSLRNDGDAEASFDLSVSPAWLHAAPPSGILTSGASTDLTVSASACTDAVVESGEIAVSGGGHEATVAVTRDCREPGVPPPVGLSIDRVYVNQAVPAHDSSQPPAARIPLVANRAGLLRVFATADDVGANAAQARFHHRHGTGPEHVTPLEGPESVPVSTSEASLSTSYDLLLPAHVLQPGLQGYVTLRASVAGETVEARFPTTGTMTFDVRSVAPAETTFVPVTYRGTTPGLGDGLAYLTDTVRMFPMAEDTIDARVSATPWPFGGDLGSGSGWVELLNDITDLYVSDPEARHHYGVVDPGYTSGIAGIAWIGHPIAVGWSHLPSGSYVAAHELGHNWGLGHAPCNVSSGVDPAFPYPDGSIGVWGYDLVDATLRSPHDHKDLMSYCRPAWVSDYHYRKVMDFRAAHAAAMGAAAADAASPVLLVRGWVDAETFHLDPLLMTALRPQPVPSGPYTFIAWDAAGDEILRLAFGTNEVSLEGVRAIHLTLPLPGDGEHHLSRVRVERNGHTVLERDLPVRPLAITPTKLTRLADGRVTITWDARAYAALLVRDGPNGALLGRDRSGELTVQPGSGVLELLYSDGLNTERDVVQY